jgi:hypothetical protein
MKRTAQIKVERFQTAVAISFQSSFQISANHRFVLITFQKDVKNEFSGTFPVFFHDLPRVRIDPSLELQTLRWNMSKINHFFVHDDDPLWKVEARVAAIRFKV